MSNDDTSPVPPASGSRWEPAATGPAYAPAPPRRNRGGLILAGGALGVALVAGAGGFALGAATADDGFDGPGRVGVRNGFPGGGPQGGPQGFPGQGQPPRGFPDRDDDDGLPD